MNKSNPLYKEDISYILSTKGIDQLKGKTVLITGATGLLGMCMIDALITLGEVNVIAVGRNKDKANDRLGEYYNSPQFTFLQQDVCQPFPSHLKVDYVIPLASNTHPKAYSQFPVETVLTNVKGAENALELAERCGATLLYPSSVEVYGNARGEDIFTEDYTGNLNLLNSRACYPESKRVCEALCQSYISEKGTDVKIVRLSRIFGPSMLLSDTKASSQFILKAVAGEDIVLKSKGNQFFSYTYVADAVAAMIYVMLNGAVGVPYNISVEACNVHLRDFAELCAKAVGKKVIFDLPDEVEQKGFSIAMNAILDNRQLLAIGWNPHYDMTNAVERTINILCS